MACDARPSSTSFVVNFNEEGEQLRRKLPKRLQDKTKESQPTKTQQEIEEKQKKAAERRQAQTSARLQRIKEREEECRRMHINVQTLLEQDAKRSGQTGTEHIKPISRKQATAMIQTVAKGFSNIGKDITSGFNQVEEAEKETV